MILRVKIDFKIEGRLDLRACFCGIVCLPVDEVVDIYSDNDVSLFYCFSAPSNTSSYPPLRSTPGGPTNQRPQNNMNKSRMAKEEVRPKAVHFVCDIYILFCRWYPCLMHIHENG